MLRPRTRRCPLKRLIAIVCLVAVATVAAPAEERVDLDMVTKIRQEGFRDSKVMETASELMDRIGPRLTGSPQAKEANNWTKDKLAEWGLSNAHLETWGPFGRGWQYEACAVRMVAPDHAELLALPDAWTPGTNGPVKGSVVRLNVKSKDELEKLKGTFTGKIVLYGDVREVKPHDKPDLTRFDEKTLAEEAQYNLPGGPPRYPREEYARRAELKRAAEAFLAEEKPLAVIELGRGDFGTFNVQGGGEYRKSKPMSVPAVALDGVGALRPDRTPARPEGRRPARARREDAFRGRRPDAVEHDRRDSGHGQEGRGRDGRGAPRLVARRHGRDRQRRRAPSWPWKRCGSSRRST